MLSSADPAILDQLSHNLNRALNRQLRHSLLFIPLLLQPGLITLELRMQPLKRIRHIKIRLAARPTTQDIHDLTAVLLVELHLGGEVLNDRLVDAATALAENDLAFRHGQVCLWGRVGLEDGGGGDGGAYEGLGAADLDLQAFPELGDVEDRAGACGIDGCCEGDVVRHVACRGVGQSYWIEWIDYVVEESVKKDIYAGCSWDVDLYSSLLCMDFGVVIACENPAPVAKPAISKDAPTLDARNLTSLGGGVICSSIAQVACMIAVHAFVTSKDLAGILFCEVLVTHMHGTEAADHARRSYLSLIRSRHSFSHQAMLALKTFPQVSCSGPSKGAGRSH
jgi:hypothetical protein